MKIKEVIELIVTALVGLVLLVNAIQLPFAWLAAGLSGGPNDTAAAKTMHSDELYIGLCALYFLIYIVIKIKLRKQKQT